jgi:hypothetical protein
MDIKHRYGVCFWNEETDQELYGYAEFTNWFDAEWEISKWAIPGFDKGCVYYIEQQDNNLYVPIETIATRADK